MHSKCPRCGLIATRPSHLMRHMQSHLPPNERNTIACFKCNRTFCRRDVLLRHLRTAHTGQAKKDRRKSCLRCVEKKLKCDRKQPCSSCASSVSKCFFSDPAATHDSLSRTENEGNTTTQAVIADRSHSLLDTFSSQAFQSLETRTEPDIFFLAENISDWEIMDEIAMAPFPVPGVNKEHFNVQLNQRRQRGSMSSQSSSPSLHAFDLALDSLNTVLSGPGWSRVESISPSEEEVADRNNHVGLDHFDLVQPSSPLAGNLPGHKTASTFPQTPDSINLQPPNHFEITAEEHSLPFPRKLLRSTMGECDRPNDIEKVQEHLATMLSGPVFLDLDESNDQLYQLAIRLFEESVRLYFLNFHPVLPVVHLSTWCMKTCPAILLSAMACIGSLFSGHESSKQISKTFSRIFCLHIEWVENSLESPRIYNPDVLSAFLLHQFYSIGSGDSQLVKKAERLHANFVQTLRDAGILVLKLGAHYGVDSDSTTKSQNDCQTNNWINWIGQERKRRVAWAAFALDCTLSVFAGKRGIIDVTELPTFLPCTEPLWDIPCSSTWNLKDTMLLTANNAHLATQLQSILAENRVEANLSLFAKKLCAQVIGRLIWDFKKMYTFPEPSLLGSDFFMDAQNRTKTKLLRGLDELRKSLSNPLSINGVIHHNLVALNFHISNLFACSPAMDMIIEFTWGRTPLIKGFADDRFRSTFASDGAKNRQLVWNAAQIIGIVNEYCVAVPSEVFRIFVAYIFILAFSRYSPKSSPSLVSSSPIKLDKPCHSAIETAAVNIWIQQGGVASIASAVDVSDAQAVSILRDEAKLLLKRVGQWGLAHKFIEMLDNLLVEEDLAW